MSGLLSDPVARAARLFIGAVGVLLAVLVAVKVVDVLPGLVAVGLLLAVGVFLTHEIGKINVGKDGFTLETYLKEARAAVAEAPPEEQADVPAVAARSLAQPGGGELTELRLRLEAKLSYIAGQMGLDSGDVSIGALRHDGYLTADEARTADNLLRLSEAELARASEQERAEFLKTGERFVDSIRAAVVAGAAQKELKRLGWSVQRGETGKRDLVATSQDGRRALVVPVFSVTETAELPAKVARRVAEIDGYDRRVIVLPDNTKATTTPGGDPAIAKLSELGDALVS
ncbi:MAG TPA: hypothetical protein VNT55_04585 [Baekduia sp.]|nr:hypothetical protein [Baekduia sp.]